MALDTRALEALRKLLWAVQLDVVRYAYSKPDQTVYAYIGNENVTDKLSLMQNYGWIEYKGDTKYTITEKGLKWL